MRLFWRLGRILYWWIKANVLPKDPRHNIQLTDDAPIIYVLPRKSYSDLLILDEECARYGLAQPRKAIKSLLTPNDAAYMYLGTLGLWAPRRVRKEPPPPLVKLIRKLEEDPNFNVQIVPVSIIWGRNPGRDERSWFKLLFPDDEHAGILQKLFIILAQGQNVLVRFGDKIWLRELVAEGAGAQETARKLRRILRVHFRTQRNVILGPKLYDRARVLETLIASRPMQAAIDAEMRAKGSKRDKVEAKARHYFREMSSAQTHAAIRFLDLLLSWLWNKKFDGLVIEHDARLQQCADRGEVICAASHRSHFDYLLLGYVMYYRGLTVPHTGAGINLNFWPVGPLLRRGGAFFLRRSFKGNRLYTTAFNEYMHYLLTKGYPMTFYPEGGRSRTGRLLDPKTGMLSMIMHSYLRDPRRDYAILPVYIAYDRVVEIQSYLKELRGTAKTKESAGQLIGARKLLKTPFGRAYLGFSEPLWLSKFLDQHQPDWRNYDVASELKPTWMNSVVAKLSREVMRRINATAVVNPVALVASLLLANPQRAMAEEDFIKSIELIVKVLRQIAYSPHVVYPRLSGKEMIAACERVSPVSRFAHPTGDVIYLGEVDGIVMSYYRNNILHLFALPSLIASFFQYNEVLTLTEIVAGTREIYPFLREELFLCYETDDIHTAVEDHVDAFVDCGLLTRDEFGSLMRPDVASDAFITLRLIGRALGHVFERYSISAVLMCQQFQKSQPIQREVFEAACQQLAQRMSILGGVNDTEYYDRSLYKSYVDMLRTMGYVEINEDGMLTARARVCELSAKLTKLLSSDIQQSIARTAVTTKG